ncbi:MAG: hypothetical protein KJZ75_00440 [Hyphomonadaceae bacterium]|nr:hypothetical protein [Hyphomonadaceae bacterium]GIK49267.1 MAG: hypothetical protein BroJett013_19640 [Alphaproteobacteria bacterium]
MEEKYPLPAIALVRLTVEPPMEKVIGFRKDGTPRVSQVWKYVMPGERFLITDRKMLDALIPENKPLEVFARLADEQDDAEPASQKPKIRRRVLGEP